MAKLKDSPPTITDVPNAIRLINLVKNFGVVQAVAGVNLDIVNGEFFAMLGPSGSGKTTVLRLIAGFETQDSGAVEIDGINVSNVPPFKRDVNTVFQNYALFPHMNIIENVEYGLKVKSINKNERRERAVAALERVQLRGYEKRTPSQLSGGQQQRVALARALVNEPKVLLLDEPLGALDLKLRREMQVELKELQQQIGITFVFVTHDQEEALTMANRIAVFNHGKIEQVGTPQEVYEKPSSDFVAGFVGISNLLHEKASEQILGKKGIFSIRPEKIRFGHEGDRKTSGLVKEIAFLGSFTRFSVELAHGDRLVLLKENDGSSEIDSTVGALVQISWNSKYEFQVG
ncbi:MAG: ATP-binding cassette domain-containing protein [Actinobacteria bacterium]|nr:ATP-binding cassette domain-containing protein [Actinomycetota bacterium]